MEENQFGTNLSYNITEAPQMEIIFMNLNVSREPVGVIAVSVDRIKLKTKTIDACLSHG